MKIKRIRDFKINQKLLISYMILIVIPVFVLGVLLYVYMTQYLERKVTSSFLVVNVQITENLDTFFRNLAKISEMPYYDNNIQKIMNKDYSHSNAPEGREYEKIQDYNAITLDYFSKLFLMNDYIDSLYLYNFTSGLGYRRGSSYTEGDNNTPPQIEWFQKIINKKGQEVVLGIHDEMPSMLNVNRVVAVGRRINKLFKHDMLGVFIINVKPERLSELYKEIALTPNSRQLIIDENQKVVYSNGEEKIGSPADPDYIQGKGSNSSYRKAKINNESVYILTNTSQYSSWKVISIIPEKELFSEIFYIKNIILISGAVLILIVFIVSWWIARSISGPIKKLRGVMKQVEDGNFDVVIDAQSEDEIGHLSKTFNKMLQEIKLLIQKTIIDGEKKRQAELQALQSQINPHFMYNTLNVIKWMAQMQAADNISDALDSLIHILNFSAKTKDELIPIREEIAFIQKYISILEIRYYNKFKVYYELSEEVFRFKTLKFLIQPFVENAIFHAFNGKSRNYQLKIEANLEKGFVVFKIVDNGKGIEPSTIKKILSGEITERKGFNSIGISNVTDRVKLCFGENCRVDIESALSKGTSITIKIPAISDELEGNDAANENNHR